MNQPGVAFRDLLAYNHSQTERWHTWFQQHPEALDVKVGEKMGAVRDLVAHIFQAELWFTTRLTGEEVSKSAFDHSSVADLFAMHERAHGLMARYLESADDAEMQRVHDLPFKEGLKATSRKLTTQFFLHSVHHWAQVAMEVRQAGMPSDGPHDILLSSAME